MTINILPARLANQIAAGEVVERPASVVKELVENSLDAGASHIRIDIEKGGAKRIKITDNGKGIIKDELTLALSRHATSKIKDLDDLEAITSLGFRGEALASISSVSRLTLTSKPKQQDSAWQAYAEGRDMDVTVTPSAHPDGSSVDVVDLFFNTPARRKFLRTEKTEFNHIEEVIKRIALANFDVGFVLTHNQKVVKQFRACQSDAQRNKRVAQICGQKFVDHALAIDCQHDGLQLYGWLASPDYYRNQNDLAYSYVNGRMMRDKLLNHAIRQAYSDLLPNDSYPAFVLFFTLNSKDVDVNVHPAKHEVRFHQGRYVHDFIYSVCQQALTDAQQGKLLTAEVVDKETGEIIDQNPLSYDTNKPFSAESDTTTPASYITALRSTDDDGQSNIHQRSSANEQVDLSLNSDSPLTTEHGSNKHFSGANQTTHSNYPQKQHAGAQSQYSSRINEKSTRAYSDLMTPLANETVSEQLAPADSTMKVADQNQTQANELLFFQAPEYAVFEQNQQLRIISIKCLAQSIKVDYIQQHWQQALISQPLLLPVKMSVSPACSEFIIAHQKQFEHVGIVLQVLKKDSIQIKQFPALLREKNVAASMELILKTLVEAEQPSESLWQSVLAELMVSESYTKTQALQIWQQAKTCLNAKFDQLITLNSASIDLTSSITLLK